MCKAPKLPITLTVGPSTYEAGATDWIALDGDGEPLGSGGSGGRAKGEITGRTDDWTGAVKRAMRDVGLDGRAFRLSQADVRPFGWSQGAGHAPQGVRVVWGG